MKSFSVGGFARSEAAADHIFLSRGRLLYEVPNVFESYFGIATPHTD
jgi:hypothetical protein